MQALLHSASAAVLCQDHYASSFISRYQDKGHCSGTVLLMASLSELQLFSCHQGLVFSGSVKVKKIVLCSEFSAVLDVCMYDLG